MNPADVLERSINSIDIQNYILNTIRMLLVPVFILKLADLFICSSESKASEYWTIFMGNKVANNVWVLSANSGLVQVWAEAG